jgi:prepilin-type N-terminal cleavage/methylation domain-containing protein
MSAIMQRRKWPVVSGQWSVVRYKPPATDNGQRTTGFTLVEMLVVITIIGVLVSLASVAVFKALEAAKSARIKMEITNLESALESFKQKYGDYPPSFVSNDPNVKNQVVTFLAKAFPRCDVATEAAYVPNISASTTPIPLSADNIGAVELVFWLTSISKDPAHPFSAATTDRQSFFDFDKTRITSLDPSTATGWQVVGTTAKYTPGVYIPVNGKDKPYLYFAARDYLFHAMRTSSTVPASVPYLYEPWDTNGNGTLDAGNSGKDIPTSNNGSLVIPASSDAYAKMCASPKSFQIISAGLDGDYGTINTSTAVPANAKYGGSNVKIYYKSYASGAGYDLAGADDDNLTNFSERKLGDAKP